MSPSRFRSPVLRPEAKTDIRDKSAWIEDHHSEAASLQFMRTIRECVAKIGEHPEAFPVVYRDVRKAVVTTLPYVIYFVYEDELVEVIAIVHERQHPSDWQDRVR